MISSIWGMRWKVTSNIGKDWGLLPPICEAKAIALSGLKLLISGHARTARHSQSFSERPEVGALYMTIVHPLFMCAGSCSKKSYLCLSLSSTPWLSNAIQQQIKTSSSTSFLSIPRPYCVTGPEKADLFFFLLKRYSYQSSDSNNRIRSGSYNTENAFQVMRIQHTCIEWSDLNHNLVIHLTFHIYWYPMTGQPLVIP